MTDDAHVLHSLAISQVMLHFAAARGVDADTCLLGTGITEAMLQDPDALIAPGQEMRLVENLMLALPDTPALGFELGLHYNISTFGTWGFAMRTSRNLREAIGRAIRYLPLSTAYCTFDTRVEGDEFILKADPSAIPAHLRRFFLERDLGTAIILMRELCLSDQTLVTRMELAGPCPPGGERLEALSRVPVRHGCSSNALVMSNAAVERPLPTYDRQLVRLLEDQCRQLLAQRQPAGVAGQVRQCLLGPLGLLATLEDVAGALLVSPRSLRRKLEAEGASFRGIVEEAREQLALQLLEMTDMKLDELSLHLGYADTASFTRAFRRWQGISPGQHRTRARAPQDSHA